MSGGWIKVVSKRERKHQEKREKFLLARNVALTEIQKAMAVVSQMKSIIINAREIEKMKKERESKKAKKEAEKEVNALHRLLSEAFEKAVKEELPMVRYFLFEPCSPVLTWDHLICGDFFQLPIITI